jgi:hypothetical protein
MKKLHSSSLADHRDKENTWCIESLTEPIINTVTQENKPIRQIDLPNPNNKDAFSFCQAKNTFYVNTNQSLTNIKPVILNPNPHYLKKSFFFFQIYLVQKILNATNSKQFRPCSPESSLMCSIQYAQTALLSNFAYNC